jgi:hypothetical protein
VETASAPTNNNVRKFFIKISPDFIEVVGQSRTIFDRLITGEADRFLYQELVENNKAIPRIERRAVPYRPNFS